MWTRRKLLLSATAGASLGFLADRSHAAQTQGRVPYFVHQPWFSDTTFDLRKDLKAAAEEDKFLALLWEQKGCEYCHEMHTTVFTRDDVVEVARKNFRFVQLDLWGDREFIDLHGEKIVEKKLARQLWVRGTPTTVFIDPHGDIVFRMPGFAKPPVFKAVYRYVAEHGYTEASLRDWVKHYGVE